MKDHARAVFARLECNALEFSIPDGYEPRSAIGPNAERIDFVIVEQDIAAEILREEVVANGRLSPRLAGVFDSVGERGKAFLQSCPSFPLLLS